MPFSNTFTYSLQIPTVDLNGGHEVQPASTYDAVRDKVMQFQCEVPKRSAQSPLVYTTACRTRVVSQSAYNRPLVMSLAASPSG